MPTILYEDIRLEIVKSACVQMDETPIRYLDKDAFEHRSKRSYMWLRCDPDRFVTTLIKHTHRRTHEERICYPRLSAGLVKNLIQRLLRNLLFGLGGALGEKMHQVVLKKLLITAESSLILNGEPGLGVIPPLDAVM